MCRLPLCESIRRKRIFLLNAVKLSSNLDEAAVWLLHLRCLEVLNFDISKDYRIWIGHFHPEDFAVEDTGVASFAGIKHNLKARYTSCCTGHRSKDAPPRPAATKSKI